MRHAAERPKADSVDRMTSPKPGLVYRNLRVRRFAGPRRDLRFTDVWNPPSPCAAARGHLTQRLESADHHRSISDRAEPQRRDRAREAEGASSSAYG